MPWDFGGVPKSLKRFLHKRHGPGRVLIPGCGSGYEIEAFSSSGWDVIGIDFSRFAVARARRLLGPLAGKVYKGDFFTYSLREGFFDMIYERHLPVHAAARSLASLCSTDGQTNRPVRCPLWILLSGS